MCARGPGVWRAAHSELCESRECERPRLNASGEGGRRWQPEERKAFLDEESVELLAKALLVEQRRVWRSFDSVGKGERACELVQPRLHRHQDGRGVQGAALVLRAHMRPTSLAVGARPRRRARPGTRQPTSMRKQ